MLMILLPLAFAAPCRAAAPRFDSVSFGLKLDASRETGQRSFSWGPTIEADLVTADTQAATRFKYGAELGYTDDRSKIESPESEQSWRGHTLDLRLLKVTALSVAGFDLVERLRLKPYVAGGLQYVDSRQDSSGEERINRFYWSPLIAAGVELGLSKKTALSLDWEQNCEGGDRKVARFSLELKVALLGESED